MGQPRILLCDIGDPIVKAWHGITHTRLVLDGVPLKVAQQFFQGEAHAEFARGQIEPLEFAQSLNLELYGFSLDEIRRAHNAHMYEVDWRTIELLKRLRIPVAFTTDTNVWQTQRERELVRLDILFPNSPIFRSNEIGGLKRDEGIFSLMIGQLATKGYVNNPNEVLLIDDSPQNIECGNMAGMLTFLFQGTAQLEQELAQQGLTQ